MNKHRTLDELDKLLDVKEVIFVNGKNRDIFRAQLNDYINQKVIKELEALKGEPGEIITYSHKQDKFIIGLGQMMERIDLRLDTLRKSL